VIAARLDAYRDVAPRGVIDLLLRLAERVRGRRLLHLSPSRFGAGSAEILHRAIPLLRDLGVETGWEVIVGTPDFYTAVARFEQSLTGMDGTVTAGALAAWVDAAGHNAAALPLDADVVMVHDLAPLPLVRHRPSEGRWVWRCHGDLSQAYRRAWHLVRPDLERYDAAIFSLPKFSPRLPIPTLIVHPSIDPLSEKNREVSRSEVGRILDRLGVPRDKPLLLQVAPYARSKDPAAVVRAYRLARKYVDCRLVLAGWGATDNPEGQAVLAEVHEAALGAPDVHVLVLPADAALEINALQRAAAIVIQLPRHEDFGLGIAEAMWKGKPVIGSLAGGIPAQVIPETTGFIVTSTEGAAFRIRQLLENPESLARLGGAAREYVRRAFLITRHLGDYLAVLASLTD
jgi:trehalose synthase